MAPCAVMSIIKTYQLFLDVVLANTYEAKSVVDVGALPFLLSHVIVAST